MKSPIAIAALFTLTGLILLTSCGVPVCVAGIGNCSAIFEKYENQPTPTVTATAVPTLTISGVSSMSVTTSSTQQFTATGGNGIYTWSVSPTTCGTFSAFTIGFFFAQTTDSCTIKAVDSSADAVTGTFSLTVGP